MKPCFLGMFFWKETINDEMDLLSNNTLVLVELSLGSKPIGCK